MLNEILKRKYGIRLLYPEFKSESNGHLLSGVTVALVLNNGRCGFMDIYDDHIKVSTKYNNFTIEKSHRFFKNLRCRYETCKGRHIGDDKELDSVLSEFFVNEENFITPVKLEPDM